MFEQAKQAGSLQDPDAILEAVNATRSELDQMEEKAGGLQERSLSLDTDEGKRKGMLLELFELKNNILIGKKAITDLEEKAKEVRAAKRKARLDAERAELTKERDKVCKSVALRWEKAHREIKTCLEEVAAADTEVGRHNAKYSKENVTSASNMLRPPVVNGVEVAGLSSEQLFSLDGLGPANVQRY
ncbi:MAG: hypothetical protein ABJH63_12520 [Rhizobiaceae bacterium]